jgi:HEAT repeat protein
MNVNPVASASGKAEPADLALRMRSLHEGDLAVLDAIAAGAAAIPVLRKLLFERDSAGLFEPRKRAVQALAALNAYAVLKEFITTWRSASDPVERFGDEVVLSAAALALAETGDEEAYFILFSIARVHPVPGVIEALGRYKRPESIPALIAALADDCAGVAAEQGLKSMGRKAVPALAETAGRVTTGLSGRETPSSIRRRRRALSILLELGSNRAAFIQIRKLANDPDDEIATLACRVGIAFGEHSQKRVCASRLVELLKRVAWPLRREIEDCLLDNFSVAREFVDRALGEPIENGSSDIARERFISSLRRVKAKASSVGDAQC